MPLNSQQKRLFLKLIMVALIMGFTLLRPHVEAWLSGKAPGSGGPKSDNTTSYSRATVDLETDSRIQVRFGRDLMSTQTSIASQMILECAEFERYTPDGMKIDNPNYEGDWDADISSEAAETVAHWILQLYTDSKISNLKEFEPWNNQLPDIDGEWEAYETRFRVWDDGNSEIIEAEDMDAAKETAEEIWQDGSWDNKIYIDVYIQQLDFDDEPIGDMDEIEVECGEETMEWKYPVRAAVESSWTDQHYYSVDL